MNAALACVLRSRRAIMGTDDKRRIEKLKDKLKIKTRRIEELREEIDEQRESDSAAVESDSAAARARRGLRQRHRALEGSV
jgi:hypothetical protein